MGEFLPPGSSAPSQLRTNSNEAWRFDADYLHEPVQGMNSSVRTQETRNDHWNTVSGHLLAINDARFKSWKEEVKDLLVFSGLFSAVVTGLLANVSESLKNGKTAPIQRVNILWFISLVFSLSSALFGLIAHQWLRELRRPSATNTPLRALPALLHMQSKSLDVYGVDRIFKALPILLILGLVFFLIGLIEYLWDLDHTVAIPVIVLICPVLLFLLFTTLYPAIQHLPYHHSKDRGRTTPPGTPCPYKSPQSWIFLRLTAAVKVSIRNIIDQVLGLWYRSDERAPMLDRLFSRPPLALRRHFDWIEHSLAWLRQRDVDFLSANPDTLEKASIGHEDANGEALAEALICPEKEFSPIYDTVEALLRVKADFEASGSPHMPDLLQCFHDLTKFTYGSDSGHAPSLAGYVNALLNQGQEDSGHPLVEIVGRKSKKLDVVVTCGRLFFLNYHHIQPLGSQSQFVTLNHLEMLVRLVRFTAEEQNDDIDDDGASNFPSNVLTKKLLDSEAAQFRGGVYLQMLDILRIFFRRVLSDTDRALRCTRFSGLLRTIAAVIGSCRINSDMRSAESSHNRILKEICTCIAGTGKPLSQIQRDGLFFVSVLYVRELLGLQPPYFYDPPPVFIELIIQLRNYKRDDKPVGRVEDYLKRLPGKVSSHIIFDFLDHEFGLVLGNGPSGWKNGRFKSLFPQRESNEPQTIRFPNKVAGESLDFGTTTLIFPYPFEFKKKDKEDKGKREAPFVITHVHHTPFPTYFSIDNSPIPKFVRLVMVPPPPPPPPNDQIPNNHLQK